MDNFVLSEQSKYTPNACVGLVAATTKPGSQIKNITIDGFEVTGNVPMQNGVVLWWDTLAVQLRMKTVMLKM